MNNIVRYNSKTFSEVREELINLITEMYPDVLSDFTDSSVGSMLIDLNAGVSNELTLGTERAFQETQLEYAQLKSSLINLAINMGLKLPNKRPSVTVVDFSIEVPPLGDKPNQQLLKSITLTRGAQVLGGGVVFETTSNIRWDSPINDMGFPNRAIIPKKDSNGMIVSYEIIKREIVFNGRTNVYRRTIQSEDVRPFFSITLPDSDVVDIEEVVLADRGIPESEVFKGDNKEGTITKYYEVDYLAQQRVFIDKIDDVETIEEDISRGNWKRTTKKFIKEYNADGYCKLTFGSGNSDDENAFKNIEFLKTGLVNEYFLDNFLNNTALGEKLESGKVLYVRYRTGGGANTNVGRNVINELGNYDLDSNSSSGREMAEIRRSLRVNNPLPAVGGNDGLDIEQIRHLIKYNFSAQQRAITERDYLTEIYKMPSKYGSPFRVNVFEENNKIVVSILGVDENNKLSNRSNNILKENLAEYLSGFRGINDYVEVRDGKIINLAFDLDIQIEDMNENIVANDIINVVRKYFDINRNEMNQDIYLGRLEREILKVTGVVNINKIVAYNKVGTQYSSNTIDVEVDVETGKIPIVNNTIYSSPTSMFEIKYPERDIVLYLRKRK